MRTINCRDALYRAPKAENRRRVSTIRMAGNETVPLNIFVLWTDSPHIHSYSAAANNGPVGNVSMNWNAALGVNTVDHLNIVIQLGR